MKTLFATRTLAYLIYIMCITLAPLTAQAVTRNVTTNSDNGDASLDGSLRKALYEAQNGDVIDCSAIAGQTVTLVYNDITFPAKDLTIEGHGVTVTGMLLTTAGNATGTTVRNLNFSNLTSGYVFALQGGTVENCRFTGNTLTTAALAVSGTATVRNCIFANNNKSAIVVTGSNTNAEITGNTFYNNTSGFGGAIYVGSDASIKLTGNLFYGNTATTIGNVVYCESSASRTRTSGGYNVSDRDLTSNMNDNRGFAFNGTGDTRISDLSFNTTTFIP
ncbi:right-handed parallel beta-helix repeat-containing protein [Viscerimonas tarda]